MMDKFEDIAATVKSIPDDEERLEYILELGSRLPGIPGVKTGVEIKGCSSRLEILKEGGEYYAASDSRMVGGLAYLFLSLASGKTDKEIEATDFMGEVSKLGLPIGYNRVTGLKALEKFLKTGGSA
ncbi:MAG: SufE family protein [Alphaproteobacteria bacterium]|nr:SufE family protein [Alphaproteobacteria bacterium]